MRLQLVGNKWRGLDAISRRSTDMRIYSFHIGGDDDDDECHTVATTAAAAAHEMEATRSEVVAEHC